MAGMATKVPDQCCNRSTGLMEIQQGRRKSSGDACVAPTVTAALPGCGSTLQRWGWWE